MTENTKLFLNTKLGRYTIQERLGSGGMARVYKGHDSNLDRSVAIKILHEHLADDPTFMERFQREAKFVASFNHPNIVQVYDFDAIDKDGDQKIFYMVMSFIPGHSLQELLKDLSPKEERLPQERVLEVMLDLCSALGYAHEQGMIHRDVKPANILFNEHKKAVLTDFGIARMAVGSQLTQEGLTVGTPAYMSPEQATGQNVDSRTDIYALGVILYELLTGYPPFKDDGSLSVLLKHISEPVPSLSQYMHMADPNLDAVIFKALAKDPEDRYQTTQEFADDLKAAFSGITPIAISLSPSQRQFTDSSIPESSSLSTESVTQIQKVITASKSPIGVLAIGMAIIAVLLFVGLISQQGNKNTTNPLTQENSESNSESESSVDSMVSMPIFFETTFNANDNYLQYWTQGTSNRLTREVLPNGGYQIVSERSGQAIATIFEPGSGYENLSIQMGATLQQDSSPSSGYGIIFRYVDDDNYNVFAVDGVGRFSIWVRSNAQWIELRDAGSSWTSNEIVNPIGEQNDLTVEIVDDMLIGYVNGEEITSVTDSTISSGGIGIYIASPPEGTTDIIVDYYRVMEVTDSMTDDYSGAESMTGDEETTEP